MRCSEEEEKSLRKSPGRVIYGATPLLSQSARVPATCASSEVSRQSHSAPVPKLTRASSEVSVRSYSTPVPSSRVARVPGTRALWDRSGVAPYITLPGDF